MTLDFRASQFRGAKFIASGSSVGGAKIVFYDIAADSTTTPNQGFINSARFNTSGIGTDIFLYVSGSRTFGTNGISVFGGALLVCGSLSQGGLSNTASGTGSHAEGESTIASGYASHAEGFLTVASGPRSHAEGLATNASGSYSHAEGGTNFAWGHASHAEGSFSDAIGDYSHAEGNNTEASGSYSHTEGRYTIASGSFSHAEGNEAISRGDYSHAEGYLALSLGIYSHAEGAGTVATGESSHAEGNSTSAAGAEAHAEGFGTQADGQNSHAEGLNNIATGSSSHAEGTETTAVGGSSHTEGVYTFTYGYASHAEGIATIASGTYSHAEGSNNIASGAYSHVEGYYTQAFGVASHAEGSFSEAHGDYSHASGESAIAYGDYSFAAGLSATYGSSSFAAGSNAKALGDYSFAIGDNTESSGSYSLTAGGSTVASGSRQVVFGKFNKQKNIDSLLVVGNGTAKANASRSDIFLINSQSVMIGSGTLGADVFLFVSGAVSSKGTTTKGVSLFNGDVHISGNLTVGGTAPGGGSSTSSLFRMEVLDYAAVSSLASTTAGQVIFPANEFSGTLTLRGIISTTNDTATGSVRFYNITSGAYVHIGGAGVTALSVSGTTPTIVQSVNLIGATNFNTGSQSAYELQISCSNASYIASFGGFELRPSGSFTNITTNTTIYSSGSGDGYWTSPVSNFIQTTGSAYITGSLFAGISGTLVPSINTTMYGSAIIAVAGTIASISSSADLGDRRGYASALIATENASLSNAAVSVIIGSFDSRIRVIDTTNIYRASQTAIIAGLSDDIADASTSAIIGSSYSSISGTVASGRNMTILGGTDHHLSRSAYSTIAGGYTNIVRKAEQSAIIAGYLNELRGREAAAQYNSVIIGGESNYVGTKIEGATQVGQASWGVIAGGYNNGIENSYSSFVGSGENNNISGRGIAANGLSAIIGGTGNSIYSSSNSTIVGSANGDIEYANNSIILGGSGNSIVNTSALSNVNILGFNWAMTQVSETTAIGNATTAHTLLISATNGVQIGGRTQITGSVGVTGSLALSFPASQGATQAPNIFWNSSLGQKTGEIWSNDTFLPNTGVLSISANSTGSNDGLMLIDGKNKVIYAANIWHHFDIGASLLSPNKSDVYFEVSGAVGSKDTSTRGTALFRGDLHVSGNITNDGFTNGRFVITGTTANATPATLWTFALSASALYDIDISIVAVGTSSGYTKRFKRNTAVSNYNLTSSFLQDSIFVPVLDVSGSSGASTWDVGLRTTGSIFYVDVTGSAATSVRWVLRSEYNFGGST